MLTKQERIAFILLCFVSCLVIGAYLIFDTIEQESFSAVYTNTTGEGTLVKIEGTVEDITTTKTGTNKILIVNGIKVFIPSTVDNTNQIIRGDRVRFFGIVQNYKGEREVLVRSQRDISVIP